MEKVLKLNKGDKIIIVNSNNTGLLIKNLNNEFKLIEVKNEYANTNIKIINKSELTSFILSDLLENSCIEMLDNSKISKLAYELLEKQYKKICGNRYNGLDDVKIEFQVITYYEK